MQLKGLQYSKLYIFETNHTIFMTSRIIIEYFDYGVSPRKMLLFFMKISNDVDFSVWSMMAFTIIPH